MRRRLRLTLRMRPFQVTLRRGTPAQSRGTCSSPPSGLAAVVQVARHSTTRVPPRVAPRSNTAGFSLGAPCDRAHRPTVRAGLSHGLLDAGQVLGRAGPSCTGSTWLAPNDSLESHRPTPRLNNRRVRGRLVSEASEERALMQFLYRSPVACASRPHGTVDYHPRLGNL